MPIDPRERYKQEQEIAAWLTMREQEGEAFMKPVVEGDLSAYRDLVIVDVGCGPRPFIEYFPAHLAVMFDCCMRGYRQQGLLQESTLSQVLCVDGMAETLPFRTDSVDVVVSLNMLDHTFAPDKVVDEFARILRPGGMVHLHVDIGGEPNACEPVVFSRDEVHRLFENFLLLYGEEQAASNPTRDQRLIRIFQKPGKKTDARPARTEDTAGSSPQDRSAVVDLKYLEILACVRCGGRLVAGTDALQCRECDARYTKEDGILVMLPPEEPAAAAASGVSRRHST